MSGSDPLKSFHPLVREWFLSRYASPTPVQAAAWPRIAAGEHVLALAPTGSGKTLAAFLGGISRLASGELPADRLSMLYVSPLKALGEDVRRNLEGPLAEIASLFRNRGVDFPSIRVATRSGDTSQADRRRMLSRPPSILVTTPESLALMLDAPSSRSMLGEVRLLILDEVHAVAADKRGSLLACQVGRLALLAGEFQRLALSATLRPPERVAAFVGGCMLSYGADGKPAYVERRVTIVDPPASKRVELCVEWPSSPEVAPPAPGAADSPRYDAVVPAIVARMEAARAKEGRGILVFTDSRRRAERLAFLLNEKRGEAVAWAHHGSLSREVRRAVEARFKAGELACVVATASLELGIDVGSVEEVVLAGSPPSVSSALQRIGRSGHGVGEISRGRIYPFHGTDLVLAAAVSRGVSERAAEELEPISCPLDILAQVILELAAEGPRTMDALYDIVLSFPPFASLSRQLFASVLEMLAGRYAGTRLRELEPRISLDRQSGVVAAKDGVRAILYSSGGAIPDRGLFSMRLSGSRAKIGELDEEFVWERKVGDAFAFGSQTWRIVDIGSESIEVVPAGPDPDIVPFWKGEARFRSPEISERALALLDRLAELDMEGGAALLRAEYGFDEGAAQSCARFVAAQKAAGAGHPSLPGTRRIAIERCDDPARRGDAARLVLHTFRGLAINEPLGMALAAAWEEEKGLPAQRIADDDAILLVVPAARTEDPAADMASLIADLGRRGRIAELVRQGLEESGLFGAQFRENAGRSLLLPRGMPGRRIPLWVTRLRAKKLFEAVRSFEGFPAIVETWRSCLGDLLDLEGAQALVGDIAAGRVELSRFSTRSPSPLARETVWKETGEFLYRGDALEGRPSSSVSDQVIAEALRASRSRPRLDPALVRDYAQRLKRLVPGWAPEDGAALAEWAKERVLIPVSELGDILAAAGPSLAASLEADPSAGGRLARLALPGSSEEILVHAERAGKLVADPAGHVAEWLRREAVVSLDRITSLFGLDRAAAAALVDELEEEGLVVAGAFLAGSDEEALVDAQNLEILLRRARRAARPSVEARPKEDLFLLVAAVQGLHAARPFAPDTRAGEEAAAAGRRALIALEGYPLPVALLETEILPPRLGPGEPIRFLDEAMESGEWQWFGAGREVVALSRIENLELFLEEGDGRSSLVPPGEEGLDFWAIKNQAGMASKKTAMALWSEAWKGLVAADSFSPLREGLVNRFGRDFPDAGESPSEGSLASGAFPGAFGAHRRLPRALRDRWRQGSPVGGRWFRLDLEGGEGRDELDFEELDAARARTLVARYGLVCRELLERELPALKWGRLFTALRRLELAGELLSGRFFEGLEGPQFMGAAAFALFQSLGSDADRQPLWLNALDPAASAMTAAAGEEAKTPSTHEGAPLRIVAPQRVAASRICFSGGRAVAASTRSYRDLAISLGADDPLLPDVLSAFTLARSRRVAPEQRIVLESVNGTPASRSPYAEALRAVGFEADRARMVLWQNIAP
jgi:ATP-dependent Lhr-like helicase